MTSLPPDDRAELEWLREQVGTLRAHRRRRGMKALAAGVLLVLGCLLAPVSLVAVWVHNQVTDTDRFVATASPLIREPAIQAAITDRVTATVFGYVDVQRLADEAVQALAVRGLPAVVAEPLRGLTGPLASSVRSYVHGKIGELVAGPAVAQLWDRVIRTGHEQLNAVLSGTSGAVVVSGGEVRVDLAPFIGAAKQDLVEAGLSIANRVPDVHPTIAVADATTLERARTAYLGLDRLADWLPWITLLLLGTGIGVAGNHRRALVAAASGVALGMLVVAASLLVARAVVVDSVPARSAAAAAAAYDVVVRFLRDGLRTVFTVGLVVVLGALLTGPSPTAVAIRNGLRKAIGRVRARGPRTGPVGPWVHTHVRALRLGVVASAVLVFVFLDRPSGLTVLLTAVLVVAALGVLQFLDRPPAEQASGPDGG